jgi:ubiquitin C-terminal hydrolase
LSIKPNKKPILQDNTISMDKFNSKTFNKLSEDKNNISLKISEENLITSINKEKKNISEPVKSQSLFSFEKNQKENLTIKSNTVKINNPLPNKKTTKLMGLANIGNSCYMYILLN